VSLALQNLNRDDRIYSVVLPPIKTLFEQEKQ
jgi:hypothetical protein